MVGYGASKSTNYIVIFPLLSNWQLTSGVRHNKHITIKCNH